MMKSLFDLAYQKGYEAGIDGIIEENPYSSDEGKAGYIAGRLDGEAYYRQYPAYKVDEVQESIDAISKDDL